MKNLSIFETQIEKHYAYKKTCTLKRLKTNSFMDVQKCPSHRGGRLIQATVLKMSFSIKILRYANKKYFKITNVSG